MFSEVARSNTANFRLASWGRCFWQDPNDGTLAIAYVSGNELLVDYSADAGRTWTALANQTPANFSTHDNYDSLMDRDGNIHLLYRTASNVVYRSIIKTGASSYTVNSAINLPGLTPGDSGNVGGVNGSLFMDVSGPTTSAETASGWPLLRIAVKDNQNRIRAFYSEPGYTTVSEDLDAGASGLHDVAPRDAGEDGGFPVIYRYTDGFNVHGMPAVTYYCEPTGTMELIVRNWETNQWSPNASDISTVTRDANTPALSGLPISYSTAISGMAAPSPLMAFGSGLGTSAIIIGNQRNIQTLYSTQSQLTPGSPDELLAEIAVAENIMTGEDVCPFGSGDRSFAVDRIIHGVHGTSESIKTNWSTPSGASPSGGLTRCDFSFTDTVDEIKFYFQDIDELHGVQAIKRVLATQYAGQSGAPPQWKFAPRTHPQSGVKNVAKVNAFFTGGSGIPCWTNFKALRHPTEPGDGTVDKRELLLLAGHNPAPTGAGVNGYVPGTLCLYDVDKDPYVHSPFPYPEFSIDYTRTSGTPLGFQDYTQYFWGDVPNLFDDNLETFAPVGSLIFNTSYIELEFAKPILVNRIEMLKCEFAESGFSEINLPNLRLETSFDGVNFTPYKQDIIMDTNFLFVPMIKTDSFNAPGLGPDAVANPVDFNVTHTIRPIVGKYIRITSTSSSIFYPGPMREYRLFGPATTIGDVRTNLNDKGLLRFTGPFESYNTETFNVRHGELPAEFYTYGDFHWYTSASGVWAKAADLPGVIPSSVGLVESGSFEGQSTGKNDGFAATVPVLPENAGSGVIEAIVTIGQDEYFNGGLFNGRPIQFDFRLDMHPDDEFEFTTIKSQKNYPPFGNFLIPQSRMLWKGDTLGYFTSPDYALGPGRYILRWEYRRGGSTDTDKIGKAWLDNVRGLDGQPQPSIRGFVRGGSVGESGYINGFAHGNELISESINGYALGTGIFESINGYALAGTIPGPTTYINGYVDGAVAQSINGFLFGNNFLTKTFPTGEIRGYVSVPSGSNSTIHGYVDTFEANTIHGYTKGFNSQTSQIHGFVDSFDITSVIYGVVNRSSGEPSSSINGFVQSRFGLGDQVINGYILVPSGVTTDIKGYTQGWEQGPSFFRDPQTMVFGYLPAYDIYSESIYGFTSGGGPVSRIKGYLQGEFTQSGASQIHGYLKRPPAIYSPIHGYVSAGKDNQQIHGYIIGTELASGAIHGYLDAFGASEINGYTFGVSGINLTSYGYVSAVDRPSSFIWGTAIGTTEEAECESHNFPLPQLPTFTIPTGNFLN